jgi:predicted nuclease of restriction endonuclease-like (RecB) superfamily
VQKTISNNWSRAVLTHQIELELYQRQGKALSNFNNHLQVLSPGDLKNRGLR